MVKICPITRVACKINGCGVKCYKKDTLDVSIKEKGLADFNLAQKVLEEVDFNINRIREWLADENRKPAIIAFTSGSLRNLAREIEFKIHTAKNKTQ